MSHRHVNSSWNIKLDVELDVVVTPNSEDVTFLKMIQYYVYVSEYKDRPQIQSHLNYIRAKSISGVDVYKYGTCDVMLSGVSWAL